jgi:tRNA-specific 2-thiouridylase
MKKTFLVAMSGGVDSSLAAALLVEQGHRVVGATMKTFCYSETPVSSKTCCGLDGIMDARSVCDRLGIPHYVFDMEEAFTRDVIDDFVSEYAAGRTPNPCVRCNSNTKIPDMLRRARMLGCDAIATGHYARVLHENDRSTILRGDDPQKDQSYFLWGVPKAVLPYLHFPVGELTKPEVRARARALQLVTADKPESQEICFVPTGTYSQFLAKRLGTAHPAVTPGELVTSSGEVLGEHQGYGAYTVGQRKGLGGGFRRPLFVLSVNPDTNQVVVGTDDELRRSDVALGDLNWVAEPPHAGDTLAVQLRHRSHAVPCVIDQIDGDIVALTLAEPQRAVTPGQSGVLYLGDRLVGGGRIR